MHAEQMMASGCNRRLDGLLAYAEAAVRLYGVVSISGYIELYRDFTGEEISMGDARSLLMDVRYKGQGYTYIKGNLVSNDIVEYDRENLSYYERIAANVPKYRPGKREFLKYAAAGYVENTPQLRRMMRYVDACGVAPGAVEAVMGEVCLLNRLRASCEEYIYMLRVHGVAVDTWDVPEICAMVADMQYNTRLWVYGGYTLRELEEVRRH